MRLSLCLPPLLLHGDESQVQPRFEIARRSGGKNLGGLDAVVTVPVAGLTIKIYLTRQSLRRGFKIGVGDVFQVQVAIADFNEFHGRGSGDVALRQAALGLLVAELLVGPANVRMFVAQDRGGQQGGVDRARLADGQGSHRHAFGHLHHG